MSKNALDVWGLDKESALHKFFVGEPMGVVASSPDGAFFAGGSLTGAAYVWECATGKLLRTWPAHFKAVSAMAFTPDGSVLVTGGDDTVVSAWTLATLLDPAQNSHPSPTPAHSWAEHSLPVTPSPSVRATGRRRARRLGIRGQDAFDPGRGHLPDDLAPRRSAPSRSTRASDALRRRRRRTRVRGAANASAAIARPRVRRVLGGARTVGGGR